MDNDDARFWIDHGLDGLQCLRATYVKHRFSPHVHGEFAIGVIERGAQRVRCRGGHEIMPERTVCVINPFETHTGQAATQAGWSYRMVYPGPGLMHRLSNQLHGRDRGVPRFAGLVIRDTWLMERFQTLHVVLEEGRSSTLARESLLLSFLAALISRHSQEHASSMPMGEPSQKASTWGARVPYLEAMSDRWRPAARGLAGGDISSIMVRQAPLLPSLNITRSEAFSAIRR